MAQTAQERLLTRFNEKRAAGLRDMKFFTEAASAVTVEAVCAEVNRFYEVFESGSGSLMGRFGDSRRTKRT